MGILIFGSMPSIQSGPPLNKFLAIYLAQVELKNNFKIVIYHKFKKWTFFKNVIYIFIILNQTNVSLPLVLMWVLCLCILFECLYWPIWWFCWKWVCFLCELCGSNNNFHTLSGAGEHPNKETMTPSTRKAKSLNSDNHNDVEDDVRDRSCGDSSHCSLFQNSYVFDATVLVATMMYKNISKPIFQWQPAHDFSLDIKPRTIRAAVRIR